MPKPDVAHLKTDKELAKLEKRISEVYKEAADDLQKTIDDYFAKFAKQDEKQRKRLEAGEITEQEYKQWRLAQMGRGERFKALQNRVAERYTKANQTAVSYVNDATPGIYSLNRNYSAYTIEKVAGNVGFDLWDEQTVRRLIVDNPEVMPYYPPEKALKRGIDLEYGKKQISASVTSSILQGKSIPGIAKDLRTRIPEMNKASAVRTARTAITGAQNAGRMDSYAAAEKMGIKLKKRWLATLDNRTRHAHAMLDGQTVDVDKPFKVDGYEIMYPGDSSAPGYLVYNCRCTQIAEVDGIDTSDAMRRARDPETGESVLIKNMTYQEWQGWKASEVVAGYAKDDAATLKFFGADARDDLKSIVKRRTIKLKNGFACFPDDDVLSGYVQKVTPLKTYFDVAMHGSPTAVGFGTTETNMSPRMLASVIRHSDGWNGQKIRMLSCSTGKQSGDAYCFAEELANALGVEVKAPNDTLFISATGNMYVGEDKDGRMVSYFPNQRRRRK